MADIPSAIPLEKIPQHVAMIMDGNGRWAIQRGLPRLAGHKAGTENLRRVIRASVEFGVKYLTIYAFSTENWGRPPEEVKGLMYILEDVIDRELNELNKEGVQLRHIGRLERLAPSLQEKVLDAIEATKNNDRLVLNVAFNYGGRDEIVLAIQKMMKDGIAPEQVTDELVSQYLFTAGVPDPDLIIRTSGELRISNFMIWQAAYAEWYITPTFWPDFDREEYYRALEAFAHRDRRYGKVSSGELQESNA
ncbi:MAG: isoprenyl transferase [Anaerolineales bacterium]|jgi:undecaprenyl diphosphate synthase|uniref:isoprenyl transferase n=1 Tax=Candidatus Villigracilis affinis TaxID=3140682 RepID=UPI001B50D0D0|nr:isoprenyl transferase [Anaerolineales bacterium]MBK9603104.1 isoprenyl transferase [Anaerolineales bacterium]MBL0346260.1 isoprenyl transferase [Anaerolineales bacterium]MBP8047848.1 isoprenyl transferase [Anaerolineales bacterium]